MSSKTRPSVLLTGFEPFGGEPVNPSWETVRRLDGERIDGYTVNARCLPTAFADAASTLREVLREHAPAAVIAVGQAGGRAQISLERVAINLIDARIPDNTGVQPIDRPVVTGGPAAYFSTLPVKSMLLALRDAGIPAEISHTAGTYVCNQVFYLLCHALHDRPEVPAGFVHTPYLPEQAVQHSGAPSMDADTLIRALRIMLRTALAPPACIPPITAGRED